MSIIILPSEAAGAAGPMRDQFLDELGGVHVLPETSKGAGRTELTSDERVAGRPLDEHGERAVEDWADGHLNEISNWSDTEGPRRSAAAPTTQGQAVDRTTPARSPCSSRGRPATLSSIITSNPLAPVEDSGRT